MGALLSRRQAPELVAAAYDAAVARKKAERRNKYVSYTRAEELQAQLEGRALERVSIYAPEYKDPASAADFWDDMVILHGSPSRRTWPESPPLVSVAAAARDGGADAAVKAVRAARQLERPAQWAVYQNLGHWKADHDAAKFGADRVVSQVLGEWSRLGLAEQEKDDE